MAKEKTQKQVLWAKLKNAQKELKTVKELEKKGEKRYNGVAIRNLIPELEANIKSTQALRETLKDK